MKLCDRWDQFSYRFSPSSLDSEFHKTEQKTLHSKEFADCEKRINGGCANLSGNYGRSQNLGNKEERKDVALTTWLLSSETRSETSDQEIVAFSNCLFLTYSAVSSTFLNHKESFLLWTGRRHKLGAVQDCWIFKFIHLGWSMAVKNTLTVVIPLPVANWSQKGRNLLVDQSRAICVQTWIRMQKVSPGILQHRTSNHSIPLLIEIWDKNVY